MGSWLRYSQTVLCDSLYHSTQQLIGNDDIQEMNGKEVSTVCGSKDWARKKHLRHIN